MLRFFRALLIALCLSWTGEVQAQPDFGRGETLVSALALPAPGRIATLSHAQYRELLASGQPGLFYRPHPIMGHPAWSSPNRRTSVNVGVGWSNDSLNLSDFLVNGFGYSGSPVRLRVRSKSVMLSVKYRF